MWECVSRLLPSKLLWMSSVTHEIKY
jgi:hypothetical protein